MDMPAAYNDSGTGVFHALQRRSALSIWQSLLLRAGLVVALVGIALAGHWFDRDGLKDNIDGAISFSDVVYFTAITVTTVGYGDIVPVSDQARMFDTFVVTPIRIFVWLLFLGTAYDFLLKRTFERIRTAMIRKTLSGHTIICGFGAKGEYAARELVSGGAKPDHIVVIDPDQQRIDMAIALGLLGICGDATQNEVLRAARIEVAGTVLIAASKDDTAALVVLSARQLNHGVPISVTARAQENEDLLTQAGATFVLNPVRIGGHLLARAGTQHHAVEYIADLTSAGGEVLLRQRPARAGDIGKPLDRIASGHAVRLLRGGQPVSHLAGEEALVRAGDILLEIVPPDAP
jgi:voltage-gated potassium channel